MRPMTWWGSPIERADVRISMLLDRSTPVAGPSHVTEEAEIDTWPSSSMAGRSAAGLARLPAQLRDCHRMSYVAIKEDMSVGPSTELLGAAV